jgi:hypothetical protein
MHWIIQNNSFNEQGFEELLRVLERGSLKYSLVKVIPFGGGVEPHVQVSGPAMVMGPLTLTRYAQEQGWVPGAFLNENFDFEVWRKQYGPYTLNADAEVYRFDEVPFQREPFFIRPCLDDKSFAGMECGWDYFKGWRDRVLALQEGYTTIPPETRVALSRTRHIQAEYRTVIVDGQVITASLYKMGGRVLPSSNVGPGVYEFAQVMANRWSPARAFVLDVFMSEGEFYVGEINCFNSAGFYAYDVGKMVAAIEEMKFP